MAAEILTAALLNTHLRDNLNAVRDGGIAIAAQAALDFIHASSATQLARVAKGTAFQVPAMNNDATAWVFRAVPMHYAATVADVLNTIVETTALSFTIPGGTMSDGDVVDVQVVCLAKNNKGTSGTDTWKANVGTGAQVTLFTGTETNSATEFTFRFQFRLQRMGTSVVIWRALSNEPRASVAEWADLGSGKADGSSTPTNFTADNLVSLKITLSAADLNFYVKPQSAIVTHYRN